MLLSKLEPLAAVESMNELLAIAYAMEQEAITGYSELAERMRREGRSDMVPVFERLIGEESQHLGSVVHWSERICNREPDRAKLKWQPAETFDDEGASAIAPELLNAYRAFSVAVRNEERAFLFWTYVAAQADRDRLREVAEQKAREELEHLSALRRERRRAFHAEIDTGGQATVSDLPKLELKLADHLEIMATRAQAAVVSSLRAAARAARARATDLMRRPLGRPPLLTSGIASDISGRPVPLCELLLDCYLDFAGSLHSEEERRRSQQFASGAVECRTLLRAAML